MLPTDETLMMPSPRPFKFPLQKLLFAIAMLLLLGGCSSRFAYNHADWLINWYIDDYIDFNRTQQALFDRHFDAHMDWHRSSELVRYERYLAVLREELNQPISPAKVAERFDQLIDFWQDFLAHGMPPMVEVFQQLSDQQIEGFLAAIEEERLEYEQEFEKTKKATLRRQRAKSIEKSLSRFIGRFSQQQRRIVDSWAEETEAFYATSITQTQRWQAELKRAFATRSEKKQFAHRLHTLFVAPKSIWPADYRRQYDINRQKTFEMLSFVQHSLSDKQRQKLHKTLGKYVADLTKIRNSKIASREGAKRLPASS